MSSFTVRVLCNIAPFHHSRDCPLKPLALPRHDTRDGFTLLEIAVVLIVIALMIAAVLLGRDLIHAGQLRRVMSQQQALESAISVFRTKYGEWPGDFSNAQSYWESASNGDGDSVIFTDNLGGGESLTAWQHLGLASLVAGEYTGVTPGVPELPMHEPGLNIPRGYMANSGYAVWDNLGVSLPIVPNRDASKFLVLGGRQNPENSVWAFVVAVLTVPDAHFIDAKLDDGTASTGRVLGLTGSRPNVAPYPPSACSSDVWNPTDNDYNFSSAAPACLILYEVSY